MKKIVLSLITAALLAACQTPMHHEAHGMPHCEPIQTTICIAPDWILDALVDGTDAQAKVMVVLTADGIMQLKAKIAEIKQTPVALQVGHHQFVSYDSKAVTSGFIVLKPFQSREEAQRVANFLLRK